MIVIKIENLSIGMEIKNYKELCRILDVKETSGRAKLNQLEWFQIYFNYNKIGHKFIITDIYDLEVEPMKDNRGGSPEINHPNFEVDRDDWNSIGVYEIKLGNQIYIGSTTQGFRTRFLNHTYEYSDSQAKDILSVGAVFSIVKILNGENEDTIRNMEQKLINLYKSSPNWVVLNRKKAWRRATKKSGYKRILVKESHYEEAIGLLNENKINYK